MRNLSDTIGRLKASRNAMADAMVDIMPGTLAGTLAGGMQGMPFAGNADRLSDFSGFGSNPGALKARAYLPGGLPHNAPLVVVLHGCTQTAAAYDQGSGWSQLADERGFALLFPEQTRANNANLCFNWFAPGDIRRDGGEAQSIRDMVAAMVAVHRLDPARVFITGLSAGGAMAATMLATYPDVFAAGAIIAGVAHGTAQGTAEAFDRMRGHGIPAPATLAALARSASPPRKRYPQVSVWQGSGDRTVDPANAEALLAQWRGVHGLPAEPTRTDSVGGYPRRVWRDASGAALVTAHDITGMGHGTPIAAAGPDALGAPAPFMLDVGISSTRHIAAGWGLQPGVADRPAVVEPAKSHDVLSIVESALRAAGILRP